MVPQAHQESTILSVIPEEETEAQRCEVTHLRCKSKAVGIASHLPNSCCSSPATHFPYPMAAQLVFRDQGKKTLYCQNAQLTTGDKEGLVSSFVLIDYDLCKVKASEGNMPFMCI